MKYIDIRNKKKEIELVYDEKGKYQMISVQTNPNESSNHCKMASTVMHFGLGMCGVSDNTEKTDTFDTDKAFSVTGDSGHSDTECLIGVNRCSVI